MGNSNFGLAISNSCNNSLIGGTSPGAGNVISANGTGIFFNSGASTGVTVQGNLIGTDASGTADLGNTTIGINVSTPEVGLVIGGSSSAARNVISGNNSIGLFLASSGSTVQGNLIGTAIDGSSPLGNGSFGVQVSGSHNQIGGTAAGTPNVIAFNGDTGIFVPSGTNNALRHNSIYSNATLGIDLATTGITANDLCDGDAGANLQQNFPVVNSAVNLGGVTTIQGTLNSTAATTFTIDLYSNSSPDPSGFGEGEVYLGSTNAISSGGCSYSFSFSISSPVTGGSGITATATDPSGNTSEFSSVITNTVNANDAPSFTKGPDQTVNEDAGPQSVPNWATNISPGPPDEAGQTLNFIVTNDNNSLFSAQPAISSAGTLTYTPAPDAFGVTTVTVQLHDNGGTADGGQDTSVAQTFTITVNAVNDAPSFTKGGDQTVNEDAGVQSVPSWAANIVKGGGTEAGQTLNFVVTNDNNPLFSTQPAISDTGTLTFTPAPEAFGVTTVTVQLHDNGGTANGGQDTSASQTFTININAVNDPPSFTKGPDQSVSKDSGPQVVANWATNISSGPANESAQTLTFVVQNNTNPGLFSAGPAISSTGTLNYTPAANASGTATITIVLMDNGGGTDTSPVQTFVISVTDANDAPEAVDDPLTSVAEDSGVRTISIASLLSNDSAGPSDESGQTLSFSLVAASEVGGTVSSDATNVYFTPTADYNGPASFQYMVTDNGTTNGVTDPKTDTATVSFTVTEVNDAPAAANETIPNSAEDAPRTIPFSTLTDNDLKGPSNESGQILIVKTVGNAVGGTVVIVGGNVAFAPTPDYFGPASFDYTVEDNGTTNGSPDPKSSGTATASFTITEVNDAPTAMNDPLGNITEGSGERIIQFSTLLGNDSRGPANESGQTLIVRTVGTAVGGTVRIVGNTVRFTPTPGYTGFAHFDYTVEDNGTTNGLPDPKTSAPATAHFNITVQRAVIKFSAAYYSVAEGAGFRVITVERTGDTSQRVTVDYVSSDHSNPPDFIPCTSPGAGFASSRCDFTTAIGRLRFAAGETSKSFNVLISQDNYLEGPETLTLTLSNPTGGAVLGVPSTAILQIADDATEPETNPIDTSNDFVRQEYHDMLNREPDASGLAFWIDNIEKCNDPARRPSGQTEAQCVDKQRESTSIAFFMSPEFQMTGGFVYRLHKGSLVGEPNYDGGSAGRFPTFLEFMFDLTQVSEGILVNNQIDGAVLEANRNRLAAEFVQRPEFLSKYGGLDNTLYVQELFNTTGITATAAQKQALVDGLTGGTESRASVLRKVVDGTVVISEGNVQFNTIYGQAFYNQEYARMFVYMEYIGYLRRNPDTAGSIHWLGKLNQFNGDPFPAEMVRSFILSPEYRSRFGQP